MKKLFAFILAAALMAACSLAVAETQISVSGSGETRIRADTAVISLGVNARDKDVLKAQQQVNDAIAAIRNALMDQGVKLIIMELRAPAQTASNTSFPT